MKHIDDITPENLDDRVRRIREDMDDLAKSEDVDSAINGLKERMTCIEEDISSLKRDTENRFFNLERQIQYLEKQ